VEHDISVAVGELVGIMEGPFKDFEGKVSEVDKARGKLKVLVNMFGRETPVELDFLQIKKI
jgi:transcriptional antiterminator NusG